MDMNYSYSTAMYESILAQLYAFLVLIKFLLFTMNIFKPKLQNNIFLPEICTFGKNSFIHCSQGSVVHIM